MAKFVLLYHGSNEPKPNFDMEAMMTAWNAWVAELAENLVDPGTGVGMSKTIFADGRVENNGGSNPMHGYCVIEAQDMEEAVNICKGHPYLMTGGSIEVAQGWQQPQ
mgnify:FL=1